MVDNGFLLTDEQMAHFIAKGYLVLQNEIPEELHRDVMKKIHYAFHEEGNPGNNILPRVPELRRFFETPVVKGALSSVLGPDYYMHPHRHCHYNQPSDRNPGGGQWHKDGFWSSMRSHRPWWAMIFYYTQDITSEMGPTAILPGSQYYEKLIGEEGAVFPTGKAGTMVLVHFDLWHRASLNVSQLDRYMLKFQFLRLKAPSAPDWNHQNPQMPEVAGVPVVQRAIWQDVWDWYRGGSGQAAPESPMDEARVLRLTKELEAEETVALNAAYSLGGQGLPGMYTLFNCLGSGSALIARRAVYGLQKSGRAAIPRFLDILQSHPDDKRRALAAFGLGMLGPDAAEAVPSLVKACKDSSEWVCRNAVEALGLIAHPGAQVVPALIDALAASLVRESLPVWDTPEEQDNQYYIRNKIGYTAALSLLRVGKSGDPGLVITALERALASKDRYVRAYAAEALTHIRTDEAVDVLIRFYRAASWCTDTHKASTF